MKVALVGYGTRGDVQPFVCLGAALRERGHEASLIVPRNGAAMARSAGLPTVELPLDVQQLFARPQAQRMLAAGRINAFFAWLRKEERGFQQDLRRALIEGTDGAETIVCHPLLEDRCAAIGEARGAAVLTTHFFPILPSRAFPSPFVSLRSLGPLNRATHRLVLRMLWHLSREEVAAMREELGLDPARSSHTTALARGEGEALVAYSPALFPPPPDWRKAAHPIGAISPWPQLRARWGEVGLDPDLEEWLAAGPPPVFLGFGSMPVLDAAGLLESSRRALRKLGVRGIVDAGWSELPGARDELIFTTAQVDHQSLLPRCAAVVHHGGSGTVHASLGAGTPTLVCSVFADQPFWGRRCRVLGVGDTLPFKKLDEQRLHAGLRSVLAPEIAAASTRLAAQMATEDPLAAALAAIEQATPGSVSAPKRAAPRAGRGGRAGR